MEALDKLAAGDKPVPPQLEQHVTHDPDELVIINKKGLGKSPKDMTPDELRKIQDRHYDEALAAIEYVVERGLSIDADPENFLIHPDSGFTILDVFVPIVNKPLIGQYDEFVGVISEVSARRRHDPDEINAREYVEYRGIEALHRYLDRKEELHAEQEQEDEAQTQRSRRNPRGVIIFPILSGDPDVIDIGDGFPRRLSEQRRQSVNKEGNARVRVPEAHTDQEHAFKDPVEQFRPVLTDALLNTTGFSDGFYVRQEVNGEKAKISSYFTNLDKTYIQISNQSGASKKYHREALQEGWGTIQAEFTCPPGTVDQEGRQIKLYNYLFTIPRELSYLGQYFATALGVSYDDLLDAEEELAKTLFPNTPITPVMLRDALGKQEIDLDKPVAFVSTFFADQIESEREVLSASSASYHFERLEALRKALEDKKK